MFNSRRSVKVMIKISVVIPTYNSKEDLKECLAALVKQTFPHESYEVIVVDDGSVDGTELVVEDIKRGIGNDFQGHIRYVKQKNSGPAVARNNGIREAEGSIISFTDSDCIAAPDWLEELDKSFENPQVVGVSGKTISPEALVFPWKIAPAGFGYTTCNMAYRKNVLKQVGGFNEKFDAPYYEDTDLALRIKDNGGNIVESERLVITHPPRILGLRGLLRHAFLHQYDSFLYGLYPSYVNDFGGPFKPIFWRFSAVGLSSILSCALFIAGFVFLGVKMVLLLAVALVTLFAFFLVKGYRLCTSCWPGNAESPVSIRDRIRTFFALLLYIPLFLMARAISSLRYGKFLY